MDNANIERKKTSMSVPEMRHLLGLGKTASYWVIKKNHFKTVVAAGKLRVMIDSFEQWYSKQFHYKKVTGQTPGSYWEKTTMSVRETAKILGIETSTLYDLMKKNHFKTFPIDNRTRIDIESFEEWFKNQTHYKKINEYIGGNQNGIDS